MAEEKKKDSAKKKAAVKRPSAKNKDIMPEGKKAAPAKSAKKVDSLAAKQRRSLIMFISAVVLASIIFIPGDMIWLWLHNAVRGTFSVLALFWPVLLLFLAVATMLDHEIPKLVFRTSFGAGMVAALNACIYIFMYDGTTDIKKTFDEGVQYDGGGVLGFIFGAPLIKLFGALPAKILIILILLVLAVFTLGIPVKQIYTTVVKQCSAKIAQFVSFIKSQFTERREKKKNDDEYFDNNEDEYDIHDLDDDEFETDNDENNHFHDRYESAYVDEDEGNSDDEYIPSDNGQYFPEDDEDDVDIQSNTDDDDYSIDISIEGKVDAPKPTKKQSTAKPAAKKSVQKSAPQPKPQPTVQPVVEEKEEEPDPYDNMPKIEPEPYEPPDEDNEDELIFDELFGDGFLDTIEEGEFKDEPKKSAPSLEKEEAPVESAVFDDTEAISEEIQSEKLSIAPPAPKKVDKPYVYPPTELLSEGKANDNNYERELKENAKKLIETLESFSVGAKIVGYCRGPSVTRYEIQPAPGVKISKITGLSDDIALNLAAEGGVRMEAPIPGKPAIGVEIPNKIVTSVTMRELLESSEFNANKSKRKLECVIGKDVAGKIVMMDLAKMPHLLIAGTTGSGKSVCVNSILMSILFRATPDEVKLILIDPKLVEFSKYKGIPHLLIPVVSDVKKAAGALGWAVAEMEDRYKELSLYNVKDIDSYNKMVEKNLASMTPEELEEQGEGEVVNGEFIPPKAKKKMPKIVIAIDELADLMMAAPGEVEDYICRLAQKARAAGMHLVIATQRPSVNVITGVIKANIPSRISLKVASFVDSKTILDTGGGEKLIGKGDMLYSPVGIPKPVRVQGGFSSDDDIEAVTDFIKHHTTSDYNNDISEEIDRISETVGAKGGTKESAADPEDIDDSDPMLEDAIKAVVELGQASTSLLQRKLRVGYARAGRLIDTMEQMGIVGPHVGSKSRDVLMTQQEYIERKISGAAQD